MKRDFLLYACAALGLLAGTGSCLNDADIYNPEKVQQSIDECFDFSTTFSCPVELSVGYQTLVNVYTENPSGNPDASPVYSAYTEKDGRFSGQMVIPSAYRGRTLYATTFDKLMTATATESGVRFTTTSQAAAGTRTVALSSGETYNQMCKRLRDEYMRLLPESSNASAKGIVEQQPNVNIQITKDNTQLTAAFVHSGASIGSKLYYYYYKTPANTNGDGSVNGHDLYNGNGNGWEVIKGQFESENYHLFKDRDDWGEIWNAWSDEGSAKYYCVGTTQDLLFYGENYDQPGTLDFPAGYTVSFFIQMVRGLDGIDQTRPLYSEAWANSLFYNGEWSHTQQQAALFKDNASQSIIIGFEDLPLRYKDCDYDYNDALFTITTQFENIKDEVIPDLVAEASESSEGTLLYEDLFPSEGDYDMNDVIVEYRWTKYFASDNRLTRIEYEFTPIHDGASYTNDFAMMIDGYVETPVVIFRDHKAALSSGETYTGQIVAGIEGVDKDQVAWDIFNPFISVQDTGYEVHLTKHKSSSAIAALVAGLTPFQQQYIAWDKGREGNYPFAMNISAKGFIPVTEAQRIETNYPDYTEWVESGGERKADWYTRYVE